MTEHTEVITEGLTAHVVSGREELLAVLKRAAAEPDFLALLSQDPHQALKEYWI